MQHMKRMIALLIFLGLAAACLVPALAEADTAYVQVTGEVNFRSGPGLDYDSYGTISAGEALEFDDTEEDERGVLWYRVEYNGAEGWISSKYATKSGAPDDEEKEAQDTVYVAGDCLNIYKLPMTDSEILGTGEAGETLAPVCIVRDEEDVCWYYITRGEIGGWVFSGEEPENEVPKDGEWVLASGGSTNVREAPSIYANSLGSLSKGSFAAYLGESKYDIRDVLWYKIEYNGTAGWVSSKYTELQQ